MNNCVKCRDMMVEALYGELDSGDRAFFDAHLATCPACAAEFKDMSAVLKVMDKRVRRDPGPEFWDGYWDRLSERRAAGNSRAIRPERIRRFSLFGKMPAWAFQAAAAIVLVLAGIALGRTLFVKPSVRADRGAPPASGTAPAVIPASAPVLQARDYFDRSKRIILAMVNYDPETQDAYGLDLPLQKQLSRELVNEAGDLKNALKSPSDRRLRDLVADLETILVQIANLESEQDVSAVEFVKQGVDRKGILLKINLTEMERPGRKASKPASPSL
ncbi:MAG: anti-sigma factor family protein [Candidatus Aminicenantales bacterium]